MEVLTVTTPPESEPISLDDAKTMLRISFDDDDTLITSIISMARRYCEAVTASTIPQQSFKLSLDHFPMSGGYYNRFIRQQIGSFDWMPNHYGQIKIPNPPLISVTSIQYLATDNSTQTVDSSIYSYNTGSPARVFPVVGQIWPIPAPQFNSVYVNYTAGMSSYPDNILQAMRLLIDHYYFHREEPMDDVQRAVHSLLGISNWGEYS
jgi:hypothetical protein